MASAWEPPVAPWSAKTKNSFAFKSVSQRWPTIITSAIDALYQASYALSYSSERDLAEEKIQESKELVERLSKLKHDMGRDKVLEKIVEDGGDPVNEYNSVLDKNKDWTWFTAPWLYAECYLYRLLRSIFAQSKHWQQYDPFATQKVGAFRSSAAAVSQLSDAVEPLIKKAEAAAHESDQNKMEEALYVIFRELVQTSLWGNSTDLSLLTHLSHADLQTLQAGGLGEKAQAERLNFILSGLGGIDQAWKALLAQKNAGTSGQARVDIILDNSGFELFTDLILGDVILSSGLADQVVFHPKDMPWFVSDVTPADFLFTLEALQSGDFFSKDTTHQGSEGVVPRTSRSSSRQRQMVADMIHFEGERRDMSPAGSRILKMEPVPEEGRDNEAYKSRHLQRNEASEKETGRAEEAQDAALTSRGRPILSNHAVGGSRSLQLDPSFFQNARSKTVSPSRSFVMDSSNMQSFSAISHSRDRSRDSRNVSDKGDDDSRRGRSVVSEHTNSTQRLAARWQSYMTSGKFALSMPANTPLGGSPQLHSSGQADFWTTYHNYPSMAIIAPQLHASLSSSRLVISKGDLNYRKWCSDAQWDFSTLFEDVLGPVKGSLNLLVLRTNKADVIVGVPKDRLATLDKEDPEWRVNGKYAVVEFVGKK